jgi:phosphoribosylformylglycinamidine (FGAM) synthase PurS component
MAVDEQVELRELERQWHEAEEVADIADNLLVDPAIEDALRHLKDGGQPGG